MKTRSFTFAFMFLASGATYAQQNVKAAIYVQDATEDYQGHRLAYEVKEQIRMSAGMRLVDNEASSGLQLHLGSIDPDQNNLRTVYSIAITLTNPSTLSIPLYLDSTEGVCGSGVIGQCANAIVARLDSNLSMVRAALSGSAK